MNSLVQVFENSEFGQVRMVRVEEKPFAVGIDIARALEYKKPTEAVSKHCMGTLVWGVTDSLGRIQETKIISLGDVARLITKAATQSKSESVRKKAEKFESWIYDEVIPQVLLTGSYSVQPIQPVVDPYKFTAEQQNENLKLQNENLRLRIELKKIDMPKPSEKENQKMELNSQKDIQSKNIQQNSVPVSAVHYFSWNEPLKSEKVDSSDWVNITDIINDQLKSYFPDVKKSRKLGAVSLNEFLVENDYAQRKFSETWTNGYYEEYTTIRFKEKGQELIQNGIAKYEKSSLKWNEDKVPYRTVYPKWHKTKAKDFFLEHQDEIKEFLMKPKKKSKKEKES